MVVGVKESSFLNMIFTAINILVLLFIFVVGMTRSNFGYWSLYPNVLFFLLKFLPSYKLTNIHIL